MHGFVQSGFELLLDVSIKSVLLAAIASLALWALRVRNPNIRHRVWTAVLMGMLVLPLLVPLTPTVPLPSWMLPELTDANDEIVRSPDEDETSIEPEQLEVLTGGSQADGREYRRADAVPPLFDSPLYDDPPAVDPGRPRPELAELSAAESQQTVRSVNVAWLARNWRTAPMGLYLCVTTIFLLRMMLGLLMTHRIVRRARRLADLNNGYPVYESSHLRVPITTGLIRPMILFPESWRSWNEDKLSEILAHESAHIRRNDFLVTCLSELNRALFWFHPLAWWLRSRLSDLAEQSCDDAVIATTGKRASYARHLLEVAGTLQSSHGRVVVSGVAMARCPKVENRINAILDMKRPLARRMGLLGVVALAAAAVPAVLLAAALRPGESELSGTRDQLVTQDDSQESSRTLNTAPSSSDRSGGDRVQTEDAKESNPHRGSARGPASSRTRQRIRGRVLNANGEGQPDANVYVVSTQTLEFNRPARQVVLGKSVTDARGQFEFEVLLPFRDDRIDRGIRGARYEQIIATADGFGPAFSDVTGLRRSDEADDLELQLADDSLPVEGRILDLEGRPVVGAKLQTVLIDTPREGIEKRIEQLRKQAMKKPNMLFSTFMAAENFLDSKFDPSQNEKIVANQLQFPSVGVPAEVVTDDQGRFSLSGVGKDRMIAVQLSGPQDRQQLVEHHHARHAANRCQHVHRQSNPHHPRCEVLVLCRARSTDQGRRDGYRHR